MKCPRFVRLVSGVADGCPSSTDMVSVGLSLTPRALFYRNLVKMGPTSLRSTVCFNLLMMAKPQPYEVVVDPMCGGGSISLEVSQSSFNAYIGHLNLKSTLGVLTAQAPSKKSKVAQCHTLGWDLSAARECMYFCNGA